MTKVDECPLGSENQIVLRLVRSLLNSGFEVRLEVPSMGQSTDIVAQRESSLTFIEAKVHDWRGALRQCRAHELVADYICIAIGTVNVSPQLIDELIPRGYGLVHCPPETEECTWIIPPTRNHNFWEPQRQRLTEKLRSISCER